MTLREMIARLEEIYADTIGTEFQHIQNPRIRNWVRDRLESRPAKHQRFDARWKSRSCGCFSRRKRSRFSCTPATSGRSAFRSRARNRSW